MIQTATDIRVLLEPGQVTELRALMPRGPRGYSDTWSGYFDFDHADELLSTARTLDRQGALGIYFVPNPVNPALIARSKNRARVVTKRDPCTTNADVVRRKWLLLDFDPERPGGISATDEEKELARERMREAAKYLQEMGFTEPVVGDSGNGYHLMYRIDLEPESDLCERITKAIAALFSDDVVKIDLSVHNPARIWKLYGTTARKGDDTEDRPHRTSRLIHVPDEIIVTPRAMLEAVASETKGEADEPVNIGLSMNGSDGPPIEEEIPHVLSYLPARLPYATGDGQTYPWLVAISGVLDKCGGDVHATESYLKARWPEEREGEYAEKLANPLTRIGWGSVVNMAKEHGYDPSAYYREWYAKNRPANGRSSGENKVCRDNTSPDGLTLDDFYSLAPENKCIFASSGDLWPNSSVNARFRPVQVGETEDGEPICIKPAVHLAQSRSVEQLTWIPGEPQIVENMIVSVAGRIHKPGCRTFNLYRAPIIKPGDSDKAGPWLEHVQTLYPDEHERLVAWFAYRVQYPGVKVNHAIVMGGAQGIGKDASLAPVRKAVGEHNFEDITPAQLLGRFNPFVKSVILRVSEARDLGDVDRYSFYEHLKIYTASPPEMLRCDEKNVREYYVPNVTGVILTTNHKTNGIYLPPDDRRHFVAWSEATKSDFTEAYWRELWGWYESGGYEHVAAYLREYDLSDFDPKAPPPKTAAFWEIVDANRAPEDAELADALDRIASDSGRDEWPAAVTISMVAKAASEEFAYWLNERRNRRQIPFRFEAAGYVPVRNEGAKDGLWKIDGRRQAVYARASDSVRDRIDAAQRLSGNTLGVPF